MDQTNLNMRYHRWLDVVNDYNYDILYHPGKANALSCKAASAPNRDLWLRMVIVSSLLELIKKPQLNGLKKEN